MKEKQRKKISTAWVLILCMLLTLIPTVPVCAETEYGYQGLQGMVETIQGVKEYNNIRLVDPSDITVLETTEQVGGYFLNQINGTMDGTTGRIEFAFCMTAGMNQIGEPGNWNFTKYNLDPDPEAKDGIAADKKTQVNIYAMEENDPYTGANWSKNKTPIINYQMGNLFVDDNKTFANITNGDGTGRITLYTDKVLESGKYLLEFGAETCGNNPGKILGVPVAFQFTVKGKYTFDQAVEAADTLYNEASANIGEQVGQYRDLERNKLNTLKEKLDQAKTLGEDASVTERDTAAKNLSEAIEALEKVRVVDITMDDISGIGTSVSVGSSGTAKTHVTSNPTENGDWRTYSWESSDNIYIDSRTGEWTALWEGQGEICAVSSWHKNNPDSIPTGKTAACTSREVSVSAEEGMLAIGIPKGNPQNGDSMLQEVVEKAVNCGISTERDALKIFTARGASLEEGDFEYIRSAFPNLKKLDLSKASVDVLPAGACEKMTELQAVILPDRLEKISPQAFNGCSSLSEVEISSGVNFIGDEAFAGCTSLNGSVLTIHAVTPPKVTEYPGDVFGDIQLAGIRVPYSCDTDYKEDRYWGKFQITSDTCEDVLKLTVAEAGALQSIAEAALEKNLQMGQGPVSESQVDTLIIKTGENAVLNYGDDIPYLQDNFLNAMTIDMSDAVLEDNRFKSSTFKNRVNLKKVRLHEDTTNIAGNAFFGCKNLKDIILPAGLKKIGSGAFGECSSIGEKIVIEAKQPPSYDGSVFPQSIRTILVPPDSVSSYKKDVAWGQYTILSQVTLSLDKKSMTLEAPEQSQLTATLKDLGSNGDTVCWSSSNSSVAEVSASMGKSVTVTALKAGTAVITASDITGKVTASCTVTVKTLAAPKVKAASASYNSVKVTWSGVSGAKGYEVYRAAKKNGSYEKIKTLTASARSFTDTGRSTGTTYYYKVLAYKTVGTTNYRGAYSSIVSAAPVPAKVTGVKASRGGSKKIKVTWKRTSGASGYTVVRSTKKTSGYKTVKIIKSGSTVKYTTGTLKKGKRYYFKVRAYRTVKGKPIYGSDSSAVSYTAK